MSAFRAPALRLIALAALSLVLSGCVATTTTGTGGTSTTVSGGGTEQLRSSLRRDLLRAGVSDECIATLPLSTLTQVKGITSRRATTSSAVLTQRQQIRTQVAKVCPDL